MHGTLGMRVLVARGRSVSLLPVRERSRGLIVHGGFQSRGHPSQGQIRVASQFGQMVCYHCQQPEHMRRAYPQS